jgi:hypothetical protein
MLTAAVAGAGRCFGWQSAAKVSMMIMRPPQQRQGRGSRWGSSAAAVLDRTDLWDPAIMDEFETIVRWRTDGSHTLVLSAALFLHIRSIDRIAARAVIEIGQ